MIGTTLLHYEITARLGAGGMGEVYRATDTKLGREVAIKVLPEAWVQDAERLARLEREARVLASLDHPNVAAIHGIEDLGGGKCLVMQLAEGEDLAQRLVRGPLPVDDALAIAAQIADGLEAAHEKGIVHRDLKPANVKVTADGIVRLLDFGLATELADGAASIDLSSSPTMIRATTQAGMILGTAAYMSPEQASGRRVDRRADIWAFGVVLVEMLTGRPVFQGDTVSEVLASVIKDEPRLERLPEGTPPHVRRLIERCLTRDPRERLRDIGEARIALARPPDEGSEAGPKVPRGRRWREGAAWLVAAAAAAFAVAGVSREMDPGSLRKLDLVAHGFFVEWYTAPVLSPDGGRIAYLADNGIWVRDLTSLESQRVADVNDATPLFWSPDGASLGYVDQKKLWRVPATGGRAIVVCDLPGAGSATGATWAPDGTITFAAWRDGMYAVAADGGRPELLFSNDPEAEVDFHYPTWLPGGRVVFVTHAESGREPLTPFGLEVFDGDQRRPVDVGLGEPVDWPVYVPSGHLLFVRPRPRQGLWAVGFDVERLERRGEPFLVAPEAVSASGSGDGSLLYVEGAVEGELGELAWVDRSGQLQSLVGEPQPGLAEPAFSPQTRQVAFTAGFDGNRELLVVGPNGGTPTRLSFTEESESAPLWLPSSVELIYSSRHGLSSTILSRRADGTAAPAVRLERSGIGLRAGYSSVSPDERWIIHARDDRGHTTMLVAPLDGEGRAGDSRPLLRIDPQPNVIDARISADGRLIAWVADDSGQPEVYVSTFPEGSGRWQVSRGGGRMPRWAGESGELFFIGGAGSGGGRSMMVSSIRETPTVSVSAATELFEVSWQGGGSLVSSLGGFDVTPDGQRLLMVRPVAGGGGAARRMILVQNWLAEFGDRQ